MSTAAREHGLASPPERLRWPVILPAVLLVLLMLWLAWRRPMPRPTAAARDTDYRVRINSADTAELQLLPGIAQTIAQRIVTYRAGHGRFTSFEQLKAVHGLGDKTVARFEPYAMLGVTPGADTPAQPDS